MSDSAIAVLNQILSEEQKVTAPDLTEKEFFNLYAAQQAFRDINVDFDDIRSGDVDGGGDGGIDFIYIVVNGRLIRDLVAAEDLKTLAQNVAIELIIVQATIEASFSLERVLRLKDTLTDILSIHKDPKDFSEAYNGDLLDAIDRFRTTHRVLVRKFPTLNISMFYVSRGDGEKIRTITNDVKRKAEAIEASAKITLPTVTGCKFTFVGARDLIELANKPPKTTYNLRCLHSIPSPHGGYVSLVKLSEYFSFITGGDGGQIVDHIFDSNVRDYQGDVEVNKAIRKTLGETAEPRTDFWWLNNGITIVAAKIGGHLSDLVIDEPTIVNGLQTSQEVFNYFANNQAALRTDERFALVRTIASTDSLTRDRIIEATNSQTGMQPSSLWATDPVHRDLEKLFPRYSLYYDRRKNSWRRKDISSSQLVGITELAQSIIAVILQEPNMARARPALYFKKDEKGHDRYKSVFSSQRYPIEIYPACALLRKKTESFMRIAEQDRQHRNNLLFYVQMTIACLATKNNKPSPNKIARMEVSAISDSLMTEALNIVRPTYKRLGATDKVAKGTTLIQRIKKKLERDLATPKGKGGMK